MMSSLTRVCVSDRSGGKRIALEHSLVKIKYDLFNEAISRRHIATVPNIAVILFSQAETHCGAETGHERPNQVSLQVELQSMLSS